MNEVKSGEVIQPDPILQLIEQIKKRISPETLEEIHIDRKESILARFRDLREKLKEQGEHEQGSYNGGQFEPNDYEKEKSDLVVGYRDCDFDIFNGRDKGEQLTLVDSDEDLNAGIDLGMHPAQNNIWFHIYISPYSKQLSEETKDGVDSKTEPVLKRRDTLDNLSENEVLIVAYFLDKAKTIFPYIIEGQVLNRDRPLLDPHQDN